MSDNRKAWTADEDHAINTLVKKHGTHRWSEISKRMLDHFGAPARTGKQCRERWHNHLNPKINKSAWSDEQEKLLFQCHQTYGNKWKSIAQHLRGRTDNDIKNKFYSSMRKKLRKINKMLGVKNSTSQVRQIKPKVLSNIIAAASSNDETVQQAWQELSKLIFCKDDKKLSKLVKGQERQKIIELIEKISSINQIYLEKKDTEKLSIKRQSMQQKNEVDEPQDIPNPPKTSRSKSKLKRISLKKRQSNKSVSESKKKISPSQNFNIELDPAYNFSLSFGDSYYSPGFHSSFTPVLAQKNSSVSNAQQKQMDQWRDFLSSPMMTRSLAKTPKMPTPGIISSSPSIAVDFRNSEFGRPEIYDSIRSNIQNQVQRNIQARK